jgi:tetratricopeptide (TPR) repeat protein
VVLLIGVVFAGWKYFKSGPPEKRPGAPVTTAEPPAPKEQKSAERKSTVAPIVAPAPVIADEKPPAEHKRLSYEEQAKVIELNSLADSDYNQGGCEKALPTYQQVLRIDPRDPRAYAAVQMCYAKARSGEQITSPDSAPHP